MPWAIHYALSWRRDKLQILGKPKHWSLLYLLKNSWLTKAMILKPSWIFWNNKALKRSFHHDPTPLNLGSVIGVLTKNDTSLSATLERWSIIAGSFHASRRKPLISSDFSKSPPCSSGLDEMSTEPRHNTTYGFFYFGRFTISTSFYVCPYYAWCSWLFISH